MIPVTPSTRMPDGDDALPKSEEEILAERIKQEQYRRQSAVIRLELYLKSRMPNRKIGLGMEDYKSEALFYCQQADFNFEAARDAFEADYQFE